MPLYRASTGGGSLDQDLTDIAALSPANDDVMQRKAGAWANRTIAQVKTDLGLPVPLRERLWLPTGAKGQTFDRGQAHGSQNPLTSGALRLFGGAVIPAGETCASVTFLSGTTAANAPTNQWCVLVKASDNSILATSPDDTTAAWAANTTKTFTWTVAYPATVDVAVKFGLCVVAGTVPTLFCVNGNSNIHGLTPSLMQNANTGLTNPASLGAISIASNGNFPAWAYWS